MIRDLRILPWLVPGVIALLLALTTPQVSFAHGGGLNAEGCHRQRSNNTYHCHRSGARQATSNSNAGRPANGFSFRNCTAARNAGYSRIRRGTYGYGPHLDRDNDGIGCE